LGQFDPAPFVDSIFHDTSDPVGNTLVTGSANRLLEEQWDNRSGIRGKNMRGGQTELSQQFLFKDNNSDFFLPNNQADTKMFLRYTQPLMRGRGLVYNQSTYVVASLAANQSFYDVSAKIQRHAFDITQAYWELFADRASYAQTERGLERLRQLHRQLAGRSNLDSLRSQQLRGEAAIARQSAALARFLAQIKTSEANLRAAVAAPELLDRSLGDVVPATPTADWRMEIQRDQELTLALESHPQIQAIRTNLRASRTRLHVAEHELRPTLDLVMESYVRGLNGDFDAAKSFGDQFSEGAMSYAAGLSFARPYRNIAARAALRERRLELQRHLFELENELLSIAADVEGAIAHVDAAYQQLDSSVRSTLATHAELEYLTARWENAFLDGTQSSLLLDQLLNAEIQLIQSENSWARAQADHMIALAKLRLASGTLLPFAPRNDLPNAPPASE
jgi:outer membrane protein TolC